MMLTAHSGCDGTAPNSREYLLYALQSGADALEVDVRRQGETLVLSHDAPTAEPLTLREAFYLLPPEKQINCDLKTAGLEEAVYCLAKEYGLENRLIFTGEVDPRLFTGVNIPFPEVRWFANINNIESGLEQRIDTMPPEDARKALLDVLQQLTGLRTAGVNWHYSHAQRVWQEARALGLGISVWTVDDEKDLRYFLALNPTNLTTNRIQLACALREKI